MNFSQRLAWMPGTPQWWSRLAADANAVKWASTNPQDRSPPPTRIIRMLPDDILDAYLRTSSPGPHRLGIEREARRREAWAAPGGRAYWISLVALAVSIGALVVSIVRG